MSGAGDFLAGIVLPVWGVVAALLGTCGVLIGMLVTAWNSRRQQHIQLEQQSVENRVARVQALRREVYMEAAAAMASALSALLQLADARHEFRDAADRFARDFATIGRIHVVASARTLQAVMQFTRELSSVQAELSVARIPIVARQQLLDSGSLAGEALARVAEEQIGARLEFANHVVAGARRLAGRIPSALVEIRRELDIPLEEATYREAFETSWNETELRLRGLLERVREERA